MLSRPKIFGCAEVPWTPGMLAIDNAGDVAQNQKRRRHGDAMAGWNADFADALPSGNS
jgi:hypothetical protein